MTITSLPQEGEALIEARKGPGGQDILVGTKRLLDFFQDLTGFGNATINRTTIINTSTQQIQLQSQAEIESIRRQLEQMRIIPHQSMAPVLRELDDLSRNLSARIEAIAGIAYALGIKQDATDTNVNKLEHLCLSNLVRQQG